jgi:hypothetical protein
VCTNPGGPVSFADYLALMLRFRPVVGLAQSREDLTTAPLRSLDSSGGFPALE